MTNITSLCVYCGSKMPADEDFKKAAHNLGLQLGQNDITLVYGGGHVGLMGITADATLEANGKVIGIIPEHLHEIEVSHEDLTELYVVDSMHTRKQMMFEKSDAFVVLPGGLGTLDETFEMITWRQLKLHDKPIILVNYKDYWKPFMDLVHHMIKAGFVEAGALNYFTVVESLDDVLPAIKSSPDAKIDADIRKM
ncbi:TIGR00730 family Rossman fold protein [Sneathiella sp. P13V-1]|uniref:LOG family protein n=1 Tax=Sneathiella sp. P13V-1 TaxID=2697366 RepID=UPI00187B37B6|nr:TIGR00730 family Rossman fold protein [Sneathiella sp. P13V-1]MBE7637436.1 TIGR00730 family Rossman fold protein [Sneathiella sp. P13V-1]